MIGRSLNFINHLISGFSPQDWLLLLLGVVLWGVFCMRGFGQRI